MNPSQAVAGDIIEGTLILGDDLSDVTQVETWDQPTGGNRLNYYPLGEIDVREGAILILPSIWMPNYDLYFSVETSGIKSNRYPIVLYQPPCESSPKITSITPSSSTEGAFINLTIYGENFNGSDIQVSTWDRPIKGQQLATYTGADLTIQQNAISLNQSMEMPNSDLFIAVETPDMTSDRYPVNLYACPCTPKQTKSGALVKSKSQFFNLFRHRFKAKKTPQRSNSSAAPEILAIIPPAAPEGTLIYPKIFGKHFDGEGVGVSVWNKPAGGSEVAYFTGSDLIVKQGMAIFLKKPVEVSSDYIPYFSVASGEEESNRFPLYPFNPCALKPKIISIAPSSTPVGSSIHPVIYGHHLDGSSPQVEMWDQPTGGNRLAYYAEVNGDLFVSKDVIYINEVVAIPDYDVYFSVEASGVKSNRYPIAVYQCACTNPPNLLNVNLFNLNRLITSHHNPVLLLGVIHASNEISRNHLPYALQ